jgi:hypothetical protein
MLLRGLGDATAGGALNLKQAAAKVQDAIDFGSIAAQQAPAGHPIYDALDNARDALSWINGQIPMFSDDGPALPRVTDTVNQAVSGIYDAAATLRTSSDVPTTFSAPSSVPLWAWIGAGVATIGGAYYLFRRRGLA